jgi:hypothetical protein
MSGNAREKFSQKGTWMISMVNDKISGWNLRRKRVMSIMNYINS